MTLRLDPDRLTRVTKHFERYVDDGRLPGFSVRVGSGDQIALDASYGMADREAGREVAADTMWRIYSMTKPITSVAAMLLWEDGLLDLSDPISRWLPEFAEVRVYDKGSLTNPFTVPTTEPIRVWNLLSHTSGLTYGFLQTSVVDGLYRQAGFDLANPPGLDLAQTVERWAALPLLFQPGSAWGYGVSTDVLGRLVEVVSGQSFESFVQDRILTPLGMVDTVWHTESDRLAALYAAFGGQAVRYDAIGDVSRPPLAHLGGGGLVSTVEDYWRFCRMLLGHGELDGTRLLAPRTLELMTRNHLPGGRDLAALSTGGFAETSFDGIGFGLGFAVTLDPVAGRSAAQAGDYFWGGLASTAFWVDPVNDLAAVFMTQLLPSSTYPIRAELRQLVSSSLT